MTAATSFQLPAGMYRDRRGFLALVIGQCVFTASMSAMPGAPAEGISERQSEANDFKFRLRRFDVIGGRTAPCVDRHYRARIHRVHADRYRRYRGRRCPRPPLQPFAWPEGDDLGAGLSSCRTMVEAQSRRMSAESAAGSGSVLYFTSVRADPEPADDQ